MELLSSGLIDKSKLRILAALGAVFLGSNYSTNAAIASELKKAEMEAASHRKILPPDPKSVNVITNESISDFKLMGVLQYRKGDSLALISAGSSNARLYAIGDMIRHDATVIDIRIHEVKINLNGVVIRVPMNRDVKAGIISSSKKPSVHNPNLKPSGELSLGSTPMALGTSEQPSSNAEFREALNRKFLNRID